MMMASSADTKGGWKALNQAMPSTAIVIARVRIRVGVRLRIGVRVLGLPLSETECPSPVHCWRHLAPVAPFFFVFCSFFFFFIHPVFLLLWQVRTAGTFSFKYGRVEVVAKLPRGDWCASLFRLPGTNR
ncbi:unnamed protein product, partial [Discosporangium mesarthrocarpum]